jgi:hypothetical protein
MNTSFPAIARGTLLALVVSAASAHAQATRTWVSSGGSDSNPCSQTAPCKTFTAALGKTLAGGEISVLDRGGYGTVIINKSVTINGEGTFASILATSGNAIKVDAAPADKVILRNLQLNGSGGGSAGVNIVSGNVTIDNCFIYGFNTGFIGGMGIFMGASGSANVDIRNTSISYSSHGVWVQTSGGGFGIATLDNVHINGMSGYGVVAASSASYITINRSHITHSAAAGIHTSTGSGVVTVTNSQLTHNNVAVSASSAGSTIRLNNVALYDNPTALATGAGATIATANNNKAAGNGGALTTNGTISGF